MLLSVIQLHFNKEKNKLELLSVTTKFTVLQKSCESFSLIGRDIVQISDERNVFLRNPFYDLIYGTNFG